MKYITGEKIKLGDIVGMGSGMRGVVVYDYGSNECYPGFNSWDTLQYGILVKSKQMGMVHYPDPDMDLSLIKREKSNTNTARNNILKQYCTHREIKKFLKLIKKIDAPKLSLWRFWEILVGEESSLDSLIRKAMHSYPIGALEKFVLDSNDVVRFAAIERLRQHGGKTAYELAKNMLSSKRIRLRIAGVLILRQLNSSEFSFKEKTIPMFLDILKTTRSRELRNEIILSFKYLRDPDAIPFLLRFLHSKDEAARAALVATLQEFPYDKNAISALKKLRSDHSPVVRYWTK